MSNEQAPPLAGVAAGLRDFWRRLLRARLARAVQDTIYESEDADGGLTAEDVLVEVAMLHRAQQRTVRR